MIKQGTLINSPRKVNIIGVSISAVNMEDSLNFVQTNFAQMKGSYICAANVHTTVMAREDRKYWQAQNEAVLSLPDGKPLSVIGRKKGFPEMDKVTGTHFMQQTFIDKRFQGKRHYFYGTTEETIKVMSTKIPIDYPELQVCGYEPSVFRELTDCEVEGLATRMNEAGAEFIWVAIGAPRQELLMYRLKGKVTGVMVGVGGAFNILAGTIEDAPAWMQNVGLEWFYRLCKEPRRLFKRYLTTNLKFLWSVIKNE